MESTLEPTTEPSTNGDQAQKQPETSPAEVQSAQDLFQFSEYIHIGPDAANCADATNGSCGNPLHFHAWCRLPNRFQDASIREKALAAKARKTRQLRDPATDAYEVLEGEMEGLLRLGEGESGRQMLIEDILSQTYWKDQLTAIREVNEEEEFKTITEDQERHRHLSSLPEDERPADEYEELTRHMEKYNKAVEVVRERERAPKREALEAKTTDELVADIREARIDAEANEDFMRVYSLWEWYIGTMKPRPIERGLPNERVFGSVDHLQAAAPEVIEELESVFGRLESAMGTKVALGNS